MFLPFLDTCISQLNERFEKHAIVAKQLSAILPSVCTETDFTDIESVVCVYNRFLPSDSLAVEAEFMRWKSYWKRQPSEKRPTDVCVALRVASELATYPSLTILLRIFAALPVTTATAERSFSALKYIKNYLRSTMTEPRLNGLAHLFINRDISLDYDAVIDRFGSSNNRHLNFV